MTTRDGTLHEIFFSPAKGTFSGDLGCFRDVVASAAFYTDDDGFQHVIVATSNGDIREVFFDSSSGIHLSEPPLANFHGIVALAAFVTTDDKSRIVIVATDDGNIREVFYRPSIGVHITQPPLAKLSGIVSVAGFATTDDKSRVVIVATRDGNVREIFYRPDLGVHITNPPLGNFPGVVSVAAFQTGDDKFRIVIVATGDGNIREVFYHPSTGVHVSQPALTNIKDVVSVAGYFTPGDNFRHVIAGTADGSVHEVFYSPRSGKGQDVLRKFRSFPFTEEVNPDVSNTAPNPYGGIDTAGVTLAVAGSQNTLYAVSLNAGVWRSTAKGPWLQLAHSPQHASSIAVDPANNAHVVVGERDGDARVELNRSGVWESVDAGDNWKYVFNPFNESGCAAAKSQAIPSVAFDSQSNVYAATACGIAKRAAGGGSFQLLSGTGGQGLFTVVATATVNGVPWVWGRTTDSFFVSKNGGTSWEQVAIPNTIGPDAVMRGSRGDSFSLAAFDRSAFTIASTKRGSATIAYNADTKEWKLADVPDGDGTGLGGRRFVKAYFVNVPGQPWMLLAGTAQGLFLSQGASTGLSWKRVAETPWALGPGDKHFWNPTSDIHSDMWDAHVGSGLTPPLWIASDGGVHRSDNALTGTFAGTPPYIHQNQGLHTHHANSLSVACHTPVSRTHVAYTTADNDAWVWDSSTWLTPNVFGDASWTDGDADNGAVAIVTRNKENPWITAFGQNLLSGSPWKQTTINSDLNFENGQFNRYIAQFVQTLEGESPTYPELDAVLMQRRPLGNPATNGELVLVRNRKFSANPDFNMANLVNWPVELNNLPAGTLGFWVSGGHAKPTYYLYANDSGSLRLFKRTGTLAPPNQTQWQPLNITELVDGASYGPAFVDPYDPNHLLVLTAAGVKVSTNGGFSFSDDPTLTSLLTASGEFPITGSFAGGNNNSVVAGGKASMSTLSHVVFSREVAGEMVVASPFTGVFYSSGNGRWQSLTPFLPLPNTPVSAVGIDCGAVYVAMQGRSVVRVRGYRDSPTAAFFRPKTNPVGAGATLATLLKAPQDSIGNTPVLIEITRLDGSKVFSGTINTDGQGALVMPGGVPSGTYVAHLRSTGSPQVASAETSFMFSF